MSGRKWVTHSQCKIYSESPLIPKLAAARTQGQKSIKSSCRYLRTELDLEVNLLLISAGTFWSLEDNLTGEGGRCLREPLSQGLVSNVPCQLLCKAHEYEHTVDRWCGECCAEKETIRARRRFRHILQIDVATGGSRGYRCTEQGQRDTNKYWLSVCECVCLLGWAFVIAVCGGWF